MFDELFEMFERDGEERRRDRRAPRQGGIRGVFSRLFGRDDHAYDDRPRYRDEHQRRTPYRDDDDFDDDHERRYRARDGRGGRGDDGDEDRAHSRREGRPRYDDDDDDDDERRYGRRRREREGAFSFFGGGGDD